ncbi:phosphonate transport system permease protein [Loktanella sp. DSM 29012]|uniref:PhnE/PtxC family ABC transporter permease n=1 Tax=Loktanella sp. DSM 29012 TaxID=1881056 RepID=UPI0008D69C8E|nr:ABC transporter permease [Loktanella sp. DSM 29012]SEQ54218.1 phosphonate transport system permease protein [Loktanella sp. DSM 29012]
MIRRRHVLAGFAAATVLALLLADLGSVRTDPWLTLAAIGRGLLSPDFSDPAGLAWATVLTVAFAFCGVALGAVSGLLLAPFYRLRPVRGLCISLRAVHELFWALLLFSVTGLSPLTGVLAIGIPYAGIFAKVFSEYLDDAPGKVPVPQVLPVLTRLLWVRLPQVLPQMRTYTLYRMECGLRSSAVLGFIGLPTLGFRLETAFKQAQYGEAVAVLALFLALILPLRIWMVWRLVPLFLIASVAALMTVDAPPMGSGALVRFLTGIVPAPLRTGADWGPWLDTVFVAQAWPGAIATLVLSQIALAGAALLAAAAFPVIVPGVVGRAGSYAGHAVLVVLRSIPDYMLAFVLLQILGPSMLPAALALGLHNGAIIAHLLGREAQGLPQRADAPRGLVLWAWDLLPRLSASFWALCLYRWEIILRDSAIMGLLGICTLGFYIQTNVQTLRMDRVLALLAVSVLLTLLIDTLSRRLRRAMRDGPALRIEGRRV